MNFSAISNKNAVGKLLRYPLRLIPNKTKVPILQGRLKGQKWIVGASVHGCWLGSYEHEKQVFMERHVKEGTVFFDVGANVGFYTLLASLLVGSQGRVISFEPVPQNLAFLKEHIRLNSITNATVIEAAVADFDGTTSFAKGANRSEGHIDANGEFEVKAISLDQLISSNQIPAPDYLKIDVEGAEMMALSGASQMLEEFHPSIFLATHGAEIHQQCCRFLASIGYALQAIDRGSVEKTDEIFAYHKHEEN